MCVCDCARGKSCEVRPGGVSGAGCTTMSKSQRDAKHPPVSGAVPIICPQLLSQGKKVVFLPLQTRVQFPFQVQIDQHVYTCRVLIVCATVYMISSCMYNFFVPNVFLTLVRACPVTADGKCLCSP